MPLLCTCESLSAGNYSQKRSVDFSQGNFKPADILYFSALVNKIVPSRDRFLKQF